MIDNITQNISEVTALPGLLSEDRPAAVNQLVEEELPQLSIELESLIGELNTFIEQTNQAGLDIEADKTSAQEAAIVANGLAKYQGVWSSGTAYLEGESVSSSGLYYISKVDSNLNHIVTDTSYWLPSPINDKINKDLSSESEKTTPIDADLIPLSDSTSSFGLKKLSWENLKATILSSFGEMIDTLTAKETPVDADMLMLADSAASNATKKLTWQNLKSVIFTNSALTGNPTAPTQTAGNNSTRLATTAYVDGKMVLGTVVNATGTAVDFTGIPSWAKKIRIIVNGVSTSGTSHLLCQLGTDSGVENTGYFNLSSVVNATVANSTGGITSSAGFILYTFANTDVKSGTIELSKIDTNKWVESHSVAIGVSNWTNSGSGNKTTTNILDRIRITTVNGTDTFDAGSINIMYEG